MSTAREDIPDPPVESRASNAHGPVVELVSSTGVRELAVLIYRSADVDETAFAPPDPSTGRVYGLAVRIGPAPADEVARDEGREVWRASAGFDADRSSAMAWIMAIAHRRAVDRLRSTRDETALPPAPVRALGRRARRHARQDRHHSQDRATHAEAAQVREALALLDPEQREALVLAYVERMQSIPPTIRSTIVPAGLPHEPDVPSAPQQEESPAWPPDMEAS